MSRRRRRTRIETEGTPIMIVLQRSQRVVNHGATIPGCRRRGLTCRTRFDGAAKGRYTSPGALTAKPFGFGGRGSSSSTAPPRLTSSASSKSSPLRPCRDSVKRRNRPGGRRSQEAGGRRKTDARGSRARTKRPKAGGDKWWMEGDQSCKDRWKRAEGQRRVQ